MAEDFPEDKYDYKPTPEVRSFAEQLLHVTGSPYFFVRVCTGQDFETEFVEDFLRLRRSSLTPSVPCSVCPTR